MRTLIKTFLLLILSVCRCYGGVFPQEKNDAISFNSKLDRHINDETFGEATVSASPKSNGVEAVTQAYVGLDAKSNRYFVDFSPVKGRSYSAIAFLREDTNTTGWAYLEVISNVTAVLPGFPMAKVNDSVRAYTAGVAEGVLTKHLINLHYLNTLDGYCDNDPNYCRRLDKFIEQNVNWMNKMVFAKRDGSPYWHQVGLFLEQLAGIADATTSSYFGPRINLLNGIKRLYLMNLNGDLGDLENALNMTQKFRQNRGGCSAFVKVANDNDLIASHVTWTAYQSMLRIIKKYDLKYGSTSTAKAGRLQAVATVKMSSYPGYITSIDDFYITSNRLAVFETTIENYNNTLWKFVQSESTIPTAVRGVVATRLAKSGTEWPKWFSNFNSGTYNNEWIVVDYNVWESLKGSPTKKASGVLTVSDQMPGSVTTKDYSGRLMANSYFASYNVPSMPEVFALSNTSAMVRTFGPIFNYTNCPRGLIFARNQSLVHDLESAIRLMRYNNFKKDPLSKCNCNPPYSAELAISARCDLNDRNGSYPMDMLKWRSHGASDMKIVNADLISSMSFVSQSGPTWDQQPPFRWSTSGMSMKDTPHYGHPDMFNFPPVVYE